MNRASRYLANVTFFALVRVVIVAFCVCICHQVQVSDGKVFERCELAQVLRYGHGLDVNDVANWVCIAQHSSSLNTSAFGGNARSGGSHGLFQISDQYWCSPPGKGVACGVTCDKLRDDDISDDLACVQIIHQEHQRLSGDGYNAWIAYETYCQENPYEYIEDCFGNEEREYIHSKSVAANVVQDDEEEDSTVYSRKRGKVYGRCELAKELFLKHKMPMEEIPTWVCIAQHESNYDTSAVGRLNTDGSADHGLFQISDLFWCHHKGGRRKACGMPCSKFLDADITDDVKCVKQIYKEHTRISGDGFTAWTVYNAYCSGKTAAYVRGCFDGIDVEEPKPSAEYRKVPSPAKVKTDKPHGKVYEPCELAEELRTKHHLPEDEIATWVCIAKHESDYNTSAIGYGDHGLFQISDIYWCSPPGRGWACGLSCADLEDSDITDDVECIRRIHREHTKLTGDGFNAWTVYPRFCSKGRSAKYIAHCPSQHTIAAQSQAYTRIASPNSIAEYEPKRGKVYGRCELAKELLEKHDMDMEEIPTWVCIVHHESNFDTSAVGRRNVDGSADHGLFQISDLFWCSHKAGQRKACGLPCSKLLDNDISDDVRCVKQIHDEHTRISGDGFTAWSVYTPYCTERTEEYIRGCFDGEVEDEDFTPPQRALSVDYVSKNKPKGKVYDECELANELRDKHRVPREQIATWVCIAQHQSGLNTSSSVSDVHGLFHISDAFWCSPPGNGQACELNCADLEDSDITDDVQCIQKIYQEHQRLFGDGFNAWVVYPQHCSQGRANDFIGHCPGFKSTTANTISYGSQQGVIKTQSKLGGRAIQASNQPVYSHVFQANPFLQHFEVVNSNVIAPTFTQPAVDEPTYEHGFNANPFLKHFETASGSIISPSYTQPSANKPTYSHEFNVNPFLRHYDTQSSAAPSNFYATSDKLSASASEEVIDSVPVSRESSSRQALTQQPALNAFTLNPFLRTISTGFTATPTSAPAFGGFSIRPTPTKSKAIGSNSYQPQNEEKAKYDAFKSLAAPHVALSTQPPRTNRLQTYNLNTFQSGPSPTPAAFTTSAPATTRLPWYQLNTLSSTKPIVSVEGTSGFFFNRDSSSSKPFSAAAFTTAKPQLFGAGSSASSTVRPFAVSSFNRGVFPSTQTTTLRPIPVTSSTTARPQLVTAAPFNRGAFPSTQTTTLRPLSVASSVNGASFNRAAVSSAVPQSVSGFSFNRGAVQTTTSRPYSVSSFSTAAPQRVGAAIQVTTSRPFSAFSSSVSGLSLNRATAPAVQTTTARPFSAASYTTRAPQSTSREVTGRYDPGRYDAGRYDSGRYDSGRYDSGRYDSGKYNPQAISQPISSPVRTTVSSFARYPTPTPTLPSREQTTARISITTLRPSSPLVTFSHPTAQPQTSRFLSKYISSDEDDVFTAPSPQLSSGSTNAQTFESFSISNPIPGVKITNLGTVGISSHSPASAAQRSGQYLPNKSLATPSLPTDVLRTVTTSDSSSNGELLASTSFNNPFQVYDSAVSGLPVESSEFYIAPSFTAKRDTEASEAPKSAETSKSTTRTELKTALTDSAGLTVSSTSAKEDETSSVTEPKETSSIVPTPVDPSQTQSSSATADQDESEVPPITAVEQDSIQPQSNKTDSVKQPSSVTLKPIPKTSSAFTAGSASAPVALRPTTTSQTVTTKPSLRQVDTLPPTRSISTRSTSTSQSKPRSTITTAAKSTIRPAAPSTSIKSAATKSASSSWTKYAVTSSSRSTPTPSASSKPSFSAIKSAPTSPARPVPTPTLKKTDITSVRSPAKPTAFAGPRLPTATTKRSQTASPSRLVQGSIVSTKPTFAAAKPSPAQPSRTATSTRSSRSTRSIIATSSSTGIVRPNSIIVTKPIQSRPANSSPAPIRQTSAVRSSPTLPATPRATGGATRITPTKSHRGPLGSLFSTSLNIYELYSRLYGSYPPTKTSSVQPATKTRQVNVAPSRTS